MIIGDCPYDGCDGVHMIAIASKCPAFTEQDCESCGRKFWLFHSRIDPEAYTESEFNEKFRIRDDGSVEEKNPKPPLTERQQKIFDMLVEEVSERMAHDLLYGTGTSEPKGLLGSSLLDQNGHK